MWAVRESLSSMVTLRFLSEDEEVTVADPRMIEISWEMDGLAGMMRSSVLARFSWRWLQQDVFAKVIRTLVLSLPYNNEY